MKKFLLLVFGVLFMYASNAQVTTRILKDRERIQTYFPQHLEKGEDVINTIEIARPNLDSVYAEDDRLQRQLARFAVKVPTNITIENGTYFEKDDFIVWKLAIFSEGATSLNFKFRNLSLPEQTKMLIYSSNKKMMIGPITNINIGNGKLMTGMLYGNKAIIEVAIPKEEKDNFNLDIEFISYGILNHSNDYLSLRDFNNSKSCNQGNNVICPEFSEWYDLREGVAVVLKDGEWWCSGSLVTDECNSGRKFFLTAFHCIDYNGEDGIISNDELNEMENWAFEFGYESSTCDPSTEPSSHEVYSGAEYLSGWSRLNGGSDFLLLEITDPNPIFYNPNIVSHSTTVNDAMTACIHHPAGDVKKIAIDTNYIGYNFTHWIVDNYEDGVTEDGSSGAPLFDSNHEIIGQLTGHLLNNTDCIDSTGGSEHGDFNFGKTKVSWTGNGTDDTSLKSWLGGEAPPDWDEFVNEKYKITGPDVVSDNATFCNDIASTGSTQWGIYPNYAVISPSYGYTNCAKIHVNPNYNGWATIKFYADYPYGSCSFYGELKKRFYIGPPDFTLAGDDYLCLNDFGFAYIISNGSGSGFNWSFYGAVSGVGDGTIADYEAIEPGWGMVCASTSNLCGTTTKCFWVEVEDCYGDGERNKLIISPVPTKDEITVNIQYLNKISNVSGKYEIYNLSERSILKKGIFLYNKFKVNVSDLENGVYIIRTFDNHNHISTAKFIILK